MVLSPETKLKRWVKRVKLFSLFQPLMHQSIEAARHFHQLFVGGESKINYSLLLSSNALAVGILEKENGVNIGNASFAGGNFY